MLPLSLAHGPIPPLILFLSLIFFLPVK